MSIRVTLNKRITQSFKDKIHLTVSRGIEFSLNLTEFAIIRTSKFCFYSLSYCKNPTIERVDNNQGYVWSNVIPASNFLNSIKGNRDLDGMIQYANNLRDEYKAYIKQPNTRRNSKRAKSYRKRIEAADIIIRRLHAVRILGIDGFRQAVYENFLAGSFDYGDIL